MTNEKKTELKVWCQKVIDDYNTEGAFDGCKFLDTGDDYDGDTDCGHAYIVFGCDPEYGLMVKLAYNCDDLQCDYEWDWLEKEGGEITSAELGTGAEIVNYLI